MSDVGCPMLDPDSFREGVGCPMLDSDSYRGELDVGCRMSEVGCPMTDVRCWIRIAIGGEWEVLIKLFSVQIA